MVKIFIGNLSQDTTAEELRSVFSQYGTVSECDVLKRYGFVHMDSKADAEEAIRNLNQRELNGMAMNVELSRGKSRATTKLHVSNLSSGCTNQELRAKFEEYGPVVECDIVKDYAFVHMERVEDAMEAISGLDNTAFQGKLMSVQLSTSRLRTAPGMGDHAGCFVCGEPGHWSKDCHLAQNGGYGVGPGGQGGGGGGYGFRGGRGFPQGAPGFGRGGPGYPGGPGIPRGPAPAFYGGSSFGAGGGYAGEASSLPMGHRPGYGPPGPYGSEAPAPYGGRAENVFPDGAAAAAYESQRHSGVDFYEQFRARPYGAGASYGDERHLPSAYSSVPASPAISRERLPLDPYERRPPPPPPASGSSYYSRDRSPVRRGPASGDGVSYERSRLSPGSSGSRSSAYDLQRARDTYSDRARYAY
ncbi:RNA-binding protein 4.1-like isoform X1 [Anguilla rostrata]|uniref:RNA-binding protein 4.1-like isoform X1 n=1 Tax=Anguilla rostrata TaxID=7938 RepID=UPI0030CBD556